MRRITAGRYRKKHRGNRGKVLALCVLFAVLFGIYAEKRLALIGDALQEAAMKSFAQEKIAETVPEYLALQPVYPEDAQVVLDTYALSRAKTDLTRALQEELNGKTCIWVPVGSLTGSMLLNGHGIRIPVVFSVEGTASVRFESALESAGINRTEYTVTAVISVELHSLSAAMPGSVSLQTAYPLYTAVQTGQVPQYVSGLH